MTTLLLLLSAIGLVPLALGMAFLGSPASGARPLRLPTGSILLCALAFNLTFLWQELWLVIPKALTPGLHPILYHNNHNWTGDSPRVDLLQGTGALATLVSGLSSLEDWSARAAHRSLGAYSCSGWHSRVFISP